MQKVYLLLRNNRQTGPYSLEEVLQMNLKPFDLVWVEGRSAAWRYPGEIESLKAFVPEAPAAAFPFQPIATEVLDGNTAVTSVPSPIATSRKIFVRMPVTGSSTATAPPPDPVSNPIEKIPATTAVPEVQTRLSRSMEEVEEDFTNWNYRKKTSLKKAPVAKKELLIAAGIIALILAGYAIISKPSLIQPAANQEKTISPVPTSPVQEHRPAASDQQAAGTEVLDEPVESLATESIKEKKPARKNATAEQLPVSALPTVRQEENVIEEPVQEEVAEPAEEPVLVQQAPVKEKKKLGVIIRSVFKKDRKEEAASEQPPAADGRQAKRRDDGNAPDDKTNLAAMIDLDASTPDNWMMGINGMKVTLRNRSNKSIAATVIVSYLDANKKLLQTRTIRFNNVSARGKATMPAPDHQYADHTSLQLGTITTGEDRYASF